jgi:MoxR-like ATPase
VLNTTGQQPPPLPAAGHNPQVRDLFARARDELRTHLVGHHRLIERLLVAAITGGHVLIEGSPGLAKTRTVNTFASILNADFVRIQSTPDLLPADLTGTNVYNQHNGSFSFISGPLFNNIVLVDEINRAPPKVQSALLEAMGEQQITASGKTYRLQDPFIVVATQNPIEHEGTYPLPEAQLDRFMFYVEVAMPDPTLEQRILSLVLNEKNNQQAPPAVSPINTDELQQARNAVQEIFISDAVRDYIVRLVTATRGYGSAGAEAKAIEHAASPRGSIFLARAAQARAWLNERDHTTPEDISVLAPDVLSGRIVLNYHAQANGITARELIHRIVDSTPVV